MHVYNCQENENVEGELELEEQHKLAAEADRRRLNFVEAEAELAQEHGRDLTEDAIDCTYSKFLLLFLASSFTLKLLKAIFIGVLRRFQHYFSYIMATVHLFMIPG